MKRLLGVLCAFLLSAAGAQAQTTYYSKASATNFSDPSGWNSATDGTGTDAPAVSEADIFVITNGAALVLDANVNVQKLTISSGSLTISSKTLTVAIPGQNNSSFTISGGTLNMNGGALVVNGNFLQSSGSFVQSGGAITIDGNNENDPATSTASAVHLFSITGGTPNCSAGTITIVDPPVATYSQGTTKAIHLAITGNTTAFSGTHTFIFGDGASSTTGNSDGFAVETWQSGTVPIQNLTVNAGPASGRWGGSSYTTGSFGTHIKGTLTINAGSEFRVNQTITSSNTLQIASIVNNGTFTSGRPSGSPTLVLGTTLTGFTLPASSVSGSGVFQNSATAPTASFANLTLNNSLGTSFAAGVLNLGSFTGNISGTFTFTTGEVNLNNQTLVMGTSPSAPGTFAYTAGGFYNGSFKRFIGTSTLPTTLGAGGTFPFSITGDNRNFRIAATTAPSTGGSLTVGLTNVSGNATVTGVDPSGNYSFNRLSNTYWTVTPGDGLTDGTFSTSASTDGILVLQSITSEPRLVQSATQGIGAHDVPSGSTSIPVGNRSSITFSGTPVNFALAFNQSNLAFFTVQSGAWEDPATWNAGRAPNSTDNVTIMAGHTVTLSTTAGTANSVLLNANAILNISGSTLTVSSPSAAGAVFTANFTTSRVNINGGTLTIGDGTTRYAGYQNNGILNVTAGTLNVNGYLISASGSSFTQSGGNINIDQNAAGNAANSYTANAGLQIATSTVSLSGGTITIIDPNAATTATAAFSYTGSSTIQAATAHTFRFGNGSSTDAGLTGTGFRIAQGSLAFGTVVVNAGLSLSNITAASTGRVVSLGATTYVRGDLTITSGELFTNGNTLSVAGNLTNNGTLTSTATLALQNYTGSVVASTVAQTVSGSGFFRNLASSPTANFTNLTINNTSATGVTFSGSGWNNVSGFTTPANAGTVSGTLTLTAGRINISGGVFTLGTSAAAGSLTYSAGGFIDGSQVRRWFLGSSTPAIGAASGQFPFVSSTNDNRSAFYGGTPAAAGWVQVKFVEEAGTTIVPTFTDAGSSIGIRSNTNWVLSTSSGFTTLVGQLAFRGDKLLTLASASAARAVAINGAAAGGSQVGTGSIASPLAIKGNTLSAAQVAQTFYFGAPNTVVTAKSGDWASPDTWVGGAVPVACQDAVISTGHAVTVTTAGNFAGNIVVNSTGSLAISAGSLTAACSGTNSVGVTNSGTLTISGGTFTVNGSVSSLSGSTFAQSGGNIIVDGNYNNDATLSVPTGTPIFSLLTSSVTLTGGTLSILDPHVGAASTDDAFRYSGTSSLAATTAHTLQLGNGAATEGTANANGFLIESYGSGRLLLGNVVINTISTLNTTTPAATYQRQVTTRNTSTQQILGNLTITSGRLQITSGNTLAVAGNITNNGELVTLGTLALATGSGTATVVNTGAQVIDGSGTFGNLAAISTSTANFFNLTINNSNATGVTFANANSLVSGSANSTVSGTFLLTNGRINTPGGSSYFGVGTSVPAAGTLTHTAGGFTDGTSLRRYYANSASVSSSSFPFLSSTGDSRTVAFSGTIGSTGGGYVQVKFNEVAGKTVVPSFTDAGANISIRSNTNWVVTTSTTSPALVATAATLTFRGDKLLDLANVNYVRAVGATAAAAGTSGVGSGSVAAPVATKSGLTNSTMAQTYYFGAPNTFTTVQNGDWSEPATWTGGVVPSACQDVIINAGHAVTVTSGAQTAGNIQIAATGSLSISAGSLTASCTASNNSYVNNAGTLSISGGTFTVNGNVNSVSGSTFAQTGGSIVVDGNNNNTSASSVATGTPIFWLQTGNVTLNGGTLTIVDPHVGTAATDDAFRYESSTTNIATTGHTLQLGDGSSTTITGNTSGFLVEPYAGTGRLTLGNVIVHTATGTNRFVAHRTSNTRIIGGNLTITSGRYVGTSASSNNLAVAGNISNSGEFVNVGTLQLTGTAAQTISGTGTFANLTATPTANFANLTINNTSTAGVTFGGTSLLSGSNSGTVSGTLTLTAGRVHAGNGVFVLGISGTAGTLGTIGSGGFSELTQVRRWFTATGATIGTSGGQFPFLTSTGENRSVFFGGTPTTGGYVQVKFTDIAGTTPVSIQEPGVLISARSNASWQVSVSTTPAFAIANGALRFRGDNLFTLFNAATVRAVGSNAVAAGTSSTGTGTVTAPEANKTSLTQTTMAQTFYFGAPTSFQTAQAGDWSEPATWTGGVVPSACQEVFIGHAVTVTTAGQASGNVLISSAGSLAISGGDLSVGCTGANNVALTNNGTLNVSGGTLTVNGNVNNTASSTFAQSGGSIVVDGNNNNLAASSVATGTPIFWLQSSNVTLSGGTLTVVDPHVGQATDDDAFRYAGSATITANTNHTLQLGNGSSQEATGNALGFLLNANGSGRILLGNVVVNTTSTGVNGNRFVSFRTSTAQLLGNLTITSGRFLINGTVAVAGNITNNGDMVTTGTLSLASGSGTSTVVTNTAAQTIGGTGTFANVAAGTSTANFTNLTINNSNSTGVTFATAGSLISGSNTGTVGTTFTLTQGLINTGSNTLILGTSAASIGTLAYTAGGFGNGSSFSRWWGTATSGTAITANSNPSAVGGRYPFITGVPGSASDRSFYVGNATAPTGGGRITVKFTDGAGMTDVTPFTDATYTVDKRSLASWQVSTVNVTNGTYNIAASASGLYSTINSNTRLTLATAAAPGLHAAGTGSFPVGQRTGVATANLANATFYLGLNNTDIPYISITNGDWNNPATWNRNAVPGAAENVVIDAATTVTMNSTQAISTVLVNSGGVLNITSNSLTLSSALTNNGTVNTSGGVLNLNNTGTTLTSNNNSGATFTVSGGTVNMGQNGTNTRVFANAGTLNVQSGTFNIYGGLSHSGTAFNQSGGAINIDPNAGGVTGSSLASSTHALNLTAIVNWTGGTITMIDPVVTSGAAHYAVYYSSSSSSTATTGHTIRFGDGTSSDGGGGATSGFLLYTTASSGRLNFGNVEVNGPGSGTATNLFRVVKPVTTATTAVAGNFTINNKGEFHMSTLGLLVKGNIVVNTGGILTANGTLTFAAPSGTSSIANTTAQSITNNGTITDGGTGNLKDVVFNSSNTITIGSPLSISGSMTLTSGKVATTASNLLTYTGTGALSGTSTGYITGPFARVIAANQSGTNAFLFPVGKTAYNPFELVNITTSTNPVTVVAEAFNGNSGGTPGGSFRILSPVRYWSVTVPTNASSLTSSLVRLYDATAAFGFDAIGYSTTQTGTYNTVGGTSATVTTTNITSTSPAVTGANIPGFYLMANKALPPTISNLTLAPSVVQCVATARTVTVKVTPGAGVVTSVVLNYSVAGGLPFSVNMVNTSGTFWSATIPAANPSGSAITWSVTATDNYNLTSTSTGTPYTDDPLAALNSSILASTNPVCAGNATTLTGAIGNAEAAATYTTPTAVTNPTTDEDLGNITISQGGNTILNNSTPINSLTGTIGTATGTAGSFSNFTGAGTVSLNAGETYSFSATTLQATTAYSNAIGIYIDYNRNGVFTDAGEAVYVSAATTSGGHTETGSFTIPATAFNGTTRMRIIVNEGLVTSPTQSVSYGEYEEYLVRINSATNGGGLVPAFTAYSWSDGTTVVGTTNPLSNFVPAATATYTLTATDANGCTIVTQPLTVTVNPIPAAPADNGTVTSQCGAPTYKATSSVNGASFRWYTQETGGTAVAGASTATFFHSGYAPNTVNSIWVSVADLNGCESPRTRIDVTSTTADALTISADGSNVICQDVIRKLEISSPAANYDSYTWSPATNLYTDAAATTPYTGGSATTVYYKNSAATTGETITVTASNSTTTCANVASVNMIVNANPTISAITANPTAICAGSTSSLSATASASSTWSWKLNGTSVGTTTGATTSTVTVTPANATSAPVVNAYVARATIAVTGCFTEATVNVVVNNIPDAPSSFTQATQCGTPVYTVASTVSAPFYRWYNQATGGAAIVGVNGTTYTPTTFSTTSANTVWVSVTDGNGCESPRTRIDVTVTAPPALTLSNSGNVSLCQDAIQTLSVTSPAANYDSYTWSPATNLYTDAAATVPYTGGSATTVYFKRNTATAGELITVTAANSSTDCSNTASVNLVVSNNPVISTVTATPASVCSGDAVSLQASANTVGTGSATIGAGATTEFGGSPYRTGLSGLTKQQLLFTKAELQAAGLSAGNFTSLTFNVTTLGAGAMTNFTISMANVGDNALSTTFLSPAMTQVYSSASFTAVSGDNKHTFVTPFTWDGNSNVLVNICYTVPTANSTSYVKADAMPGMNVNIVGSSTATCATTTGASTNTNRPYVVFEGPKSVNSTSANAWVWTLNGSSVGTAASVSANPVNNTAAPVTNTYTVKATNASTTCFGTATVDVVVYPAVAAPTSTTTTPQCGVPQYSVTAVAGATYKWYTVGTGGTAIAGATGNTYTHTGYAPGDNTLYVSMVNAYGCEGPRTMIKVTVNTPPALTLSRTGTVNTCVGNIETLSVSSTLSDFDTYTWSPATNLYTDAAATTPYTGGSATTVYYKRADFSNGETITVSASNSTSACSSIASVTIAVNNKPSITSITATPANACPGTAITLAATSTLVGNGPVTVGAGATSTSSYNAPFYSLYSNKHMQILFKASELTAAGLLPGNITALNFPTTSGTIALTGFSLKMGQTTASDMSSFISSGLTPVYSAASFAQAAGNNRVALSTPFAWDGTSNIVVEICFGNPSSTTTLASTSPADATTYVSVIKTHATTTGGTAAGTICPDVATNVLTYSVRPKVLFEGQTLQTTTSTNNWSWTLNGASVGTGASVSTTAANNTSAPVTHTYTATAADAVTGCSSTATVDVTVNPTPDAPVSTTIGSQCGVPVYTVQDVTGATFNWYTQSSGGSAIALGTGSTFTHNGYTPNSTNTLYVSLVSAAGCESARTAIAVTVATPPELTLSASGTVTMCLGAIQPLSVTSDAANYDSYTWTPSTNLYTDAAATVPYTGGSATTVYYKRADATVGETITLTAINNGSSCNSVVNLTMVVNAAPVITSVTATPNAICSGSTATLTATATSTDVGSATVGNGSVAIATSTGGSGLSPFSQYFEGQHTQFLVLASDLSAAGILPGNLTSVSFNVTAALSTRVFSGYTVKMGATSATNLTGLLSPAFTTVYGPSNLTVAATGPNTLSFSTPFNWDGTSNLVLDVCFSNDPTSAGTFYTQNTTVMGTTKSYTATYGYYQDNSALCGTTGGTQVSSTTLPNMTFSGVVNSGATNWTWSLNGNPAGTGASLNVSPVNTTGAPLTNTYTVKATNAATGCFSTATVDVTVNTIPDAPVSSTVLTQCGVPVYTVSSPVSGATYKWYTQATGGTAISGATGSSYTYTGYTAGTDNTLYVSVTSAAGCESARTAITVTTTAPPTLTVSLASPVTMCPSTIQTVSISSTLSDFETYTWSPMTNLYTDAAATIPYTGGSATTVYYKRSTVTTGETITVTGANSTTACGSNASVIMVVNPNPTISTVTASSSAVCPGGSVSLSATAMTIASGTATVGNGSTTTSSYNAPFYSLYSNKHMQILFKASELTASGLGAGSITALSFPTTSGTIALTDFSVKMGQTTATDMSSFISSGLTPVYSAASFAQAAGNNRVALSTPFTWDGTSNIVVEICFGNPSSTVTLSSTAPADATSYVSVIKTHSTASPGTAASAICPDVTTNVLTYSVRPRVLFEGQVTTNVTNTFSWSWSLNGSTVGSPAANTTTTPSNSGSTPVTNVYTVKATNGTTGCFSTGTVSVTVNPTPAAPTNLSAPNQCGVPVYTASSPLPGATYKWYTQATGGVAIAGATGASYTFTGAASGATNTLYVSVVSASGCESARTAAPVTVTTPPALTLSRSGNVNVCQNGVQALSVTSTLSNYDSYVWSPSTNLYTNAAATIAYTGGSATTVYYKRSSGTGAETITVAATNSGSGCGTSASVTMMVNANPTITSVTASASTICSGSTVTLTGASTPTSNWTWTLNGSPVGTASSSISISPANSTNAPVTYTYTATATVAATGCSASGTVSVTVYKPSTAPTALTATQTEVCRGTSITLSQTGGVRGMNAYWQWYTSPNFTAASKVGAALGSDDALLTVTPTVTTTYYLRAEGGAAPCAGTVPALTSVRVTVNPLTVGGTASSTTACYNTVPGNVLLVGNTGAVVKWQKSTTSDFSSDVTDIASTSTTLSGSLIGAVTSTTYVRALVQSGNCSSAYSGTGTITVNATSNGGTISSANPHVCTGSAVAGSFTLSGHTGAVVKWQKSTTSDFSSNVTDIASTATTLDGSLIGVVSADTWIRAVVANDPCSSANSAAFALVVDPLTVGGTANGTQDICYGAVPADLTLTGQTGSVVKWEMSTTSDFSANVTDIANSASATLSGVTIGGLTGDTYFRAVVQSGECAPANSSIVKVTVGTSVTWTGAVSTDWTDAGNWCGSVPTSTTDVVLPANPVRQPRILTGTTGFVRNIAIASGAALTIDGSFMVYGNLDNQGGSIDASNGSLAFLGSTRQDIDGFTAKNVTVNTAGGIRLTQGTITVSATLALTQGIVDLNGNNMVAGALTGGSASSYIVTSTGSITVRTVNGTQLVPVGVSASSYSPLTISNSEGHDWRVQVVSGIQPSNGVWHAAAALQRTWDITPFQAGTSTPVTPTTSNLTFEYADGDAPAGWNPAAVIVNHFVTSTGGWETVGGAPSVGSSGGRSTATITYTGTYSPFALSQSNSPLPVTLLSFTGRRNGNNNELKWKTAMEANNFGFEVERSEDGVRFTRIGFVATQAQGGNSSSLLSYSFVDANPAGTKWHYRLRQLDNDGHSKLSNTILLRGEGIQLLTVTKLYPNPAANYTMLGIEAPQRTPLTIVVTDQSGRRVISQRATAEAGTNALSIPLIGLANGTYYVQAVYENGTVSNALKLVKH